jgi:GNAT superfamily N-acetyltransferase
MNVRDARRDDAGQIVELLTELGYSVGLDHVRQRLGGGSERVLVAAGGGRLLGLASVAIQSMLVSPYRSARLTAIVVRTDARRAGVGRKLVEAGIAHARDQACSGIELTSAIRPGREAAHQFYPALGFRRTSYRYWLPFGG